MASSVLDFIVLDKLDKCEIKQKDKIIWFIYKYLEILDY